MVEAEPVTGQTKLQESDGSGSPAGASKRSNWRLLIAGAVLAGGLSGYVVWHAWAKGQPEALKSTFACVTQGCGFQEVRGMSIGESLPLQCPKCGQKTLFVSNACPRCGTPNVMNEVQGLAGPTKCSQCGAEIRHEE